MVDLYISSDPIGKAIIRQLTEKRIARIKGKLSQLELRHKGKEQNLTYHAGWDMGNRVGQLDILEWLLYDILEVEEP